MNGTGESLDASVAGTLAAEMGLVRDAVMLVASGHSSRVVVAGLTFGEDLLPSARALAAEHGLTIQPRWTADEVGASLVVVRLGGAA
jgi:hypothetical protein